MRLKRAQEKIMKFTEERNWNFYHTIKNCLNVEAGELLSLIEWMSDEQVSEALKNEYFNKALKDELSDIFHYLLAICNKLNIDIIESFDEKFESNVARFPVDKAIKFNPIAWKIKKIKEKKEVKL